MKRIKLIACGASDTIKSAFREKRIEKALEVAMLNAQEDLETVKFELEEWPATRTPGISAEGIISNLVNLISQRKQAEYTIEILNEVKNYLNDEIKE